MNNLESVSDANDTVERIDMIIGGERRQAADGRVIETVSPATGRVLALLPRAEEADVDLAVEQAQSAFGGWRRTPAVDRAKLLYALADAVEAHAAELADLDVSENGSPIREMRKDAFHGAWSLRYFAGLALQLQGATIPTDFDRIDYTVREPFGVVGRIIPFNHPFMFAARTIGAPLIAGNTVILKPSEYTSLSAIRLVELASSILPAGVLNVVTGLGSEAGDALVRHPLVRRIAFTGSADTGRLIQQRAASTGVKAVSLELGGKNPIVVFPDADLDMALEGAIGGMNFTWQGQSCGSTSRLLVHQSIRAPFVERLAARLKAMRSGAPDDESTDIGAMVNQAQFDKVVSYVGIAVADGARIVAGGGRPEDPALDDGLFLRPTLLEDVMPDSRVAQEEIFGPVLATIPFHDYDEALQIANGVRYGLTASVFTSSLATAHAFSRDVEAGYVWVNDSARHFHGTPFSGSKDSGVGTEESFDELESYSRLKNVNIRFGA